MDPGLLQRLATPLTRAQAIRSGELIDCTRAARWSGFTVPTAMSRAAWEECIGVIGRVPGADVNMRLAWHLGAAYGAAQRYKRAGMLLPAVQFRGRTVKGDRAVLLIMTAHFDAGQAAISINLEAEA